MKFWKCPVMLFVVLSSSDIQGYGAPETEKEKLSDVTSLGI
jgi:hypothetical protein